MTADHTEWTGAGTLSIVVQGALTAANINDIANNCSHWRTLFPAGEIVLAISISDILASGTDASLSLIDLFRIDQVSRSWAIIKACCDKIVSASPAVPLPPIKNDTPHRNNVNLQIAAAQAGLAAATGNYVLRIRNDFIFLNDSFLNQYEQAQPLSRGGFQTFDQRVMISWLYTLNPFTVERMPFSFSDWFHFGLLSDVRKLWQVPPMSLADAVFYRAFPHRSDSSLRERQFFCRLAVEQHIHYNYFCSRFPELRLSTHNDLSSRDDSLKVLADNFVVCDLVAAGAVFEKYNHEFSNDEMLYHCITRAQWQDLVQERDADVRDTLGEAIALFSASSGPLVVPATLPARRFKTEQGRQTGELLISREPGLFFYGPYVSLVEGHYEAWLDTDEITGMGSARLRVTSEAGTRILAERTFPRGHADPLRIDFAVEREGAQKVEILCWLEGTLRMSLRSVSIALHTPTEASPRRAGWLQQLRNGSPQ